MKITIANRLRPFMHQPGTYCLLPGSHLRMQIFPALIRVHDLSGLKPHCLAEITLDLPAPLLDFTVQLDLEKGQIHVWGKGLRYSLAALEAPDTLFALITTSRLPLSCSGQVKVFSVNETTRVIGFPGYSADSLALYPFSALSRLSLGCHKAQDWALVTRRKMMSEIFPFWFRIGQTLTSSGSVSGGTVSLLKACSSSDKRDLEQAFKNVFLAGFEGILSPRLTDEGYYGFHLPPLEKSSSGSPLILLSEGARLIQNMLIQADGAQITFLPTLPPSFHSGRLTDISFEGIGTFYLEWSKKLLKKLIFYPETDRTLKLIFQNALKKCRIRIGQQDRGREYLLPIDLTPSLGDAYYFDRFQK